VSPWASINSKWVKDLNIRFEILKLVQEKAGNTLEAVDISKDFLSRTQTVQQPREKIDKLHYMKLNSFCTTKVMASKFNSVPTK
jgi:hypothetical protein